MTVRVKKTYMGDAARILAALALLCGAVTVWGARPKAKAKVDPTELLRQAGRSIEAYDFDKAAELLDEVAAATTEAKKPVEAPAGFDEMRRRAELGQTMLARVEKIAVIDSIVVDSVDFFNHYKLSAPSGFISTADALPDRSDAAPGMPVYITEGGEAMLWTEIAANGRMQMVESSLLADGKWETPKTLKGNFAENGEAAYPFLMSDGATLYYAASGDNSLGGLDIFITVNDGETYLQPQNVGMPYNSPFNDFLMAVDELTGVGWWATDRNHIPGKLTIYVFVPQDVRVNYPFDTPGLPDLAFIKSVKATQDPDVDYSGKLEAIARIGTEQKATAAEFRFPLPDGRVLTAFDDLHTSEAVAAMEALLDKETELAELQMELADMRRRYAAGETALSTEILRDETRMEELRTIIKRIKNNIIRLEAGK